MTPRGLEVGFLVALVSGSLAWIVPFAFSNSYPSGIPVLLSESVLPKTVDCEKESIFTQRTAGAPKPAVSVFVGISTV